MEDLRPNLIQDASKKVIKSKNPEQELSPDVIFLCFDELLEQARKLGLNIKSSNNIIRQNSEPPTVSRNTVVIVPQKDGLEKAYTRSNDGKVSSHELVNEQSPNGELPTTVGKLVALTSEPYRLTAMVLQEDNKIHCYVIRPPGSRLAMTEGNGLLALSLPASPQQK